MMHELGFRMIASRHFRAGVLGALLCLALLAGGPVARAQGDCTAESEPNDQPAQATAIPPGALCLEGELESEDQDLFVWTVTEDDAQRRWDFTLTGLPDQLTSLRLLRVEFAENGTDVLGSTVLYKLDSLNAAASTVAGLLLAPGTYYLGVAKSGGEGAYRVDIGAGDALPAVGDVEPNDNLTQPTPLSGAVSLSGDLQGSDDWYLWTVSEADAAQRWHIVLQLPPGVAGSLDITQVDGPWLDHVAPADDGRAAMHHLGLAAGNYLIQVGQRADQPVPYVLTIQPAGPRAADVEEEPNHAVDIAYPLDPARPMQGHSTPGRADYDYYRFTVDATFGQQQHTVSVTSATAATLELCLLDGAGTQIQCRDGAQPALADLVLPAGDYGLYVRVRDNLALDYTIQFTATGRPQDGFEMEPNDLQTYASPLADNANLRGRAAGRDDDFLTFTIEGEPQLWRVQVLGEGLQDVALYANGGAEVQRRNAQPGERAIRLDNLYLLPGQHWLRLRGTDTDYAVRLIPLGPPLDTPAPSSGEPPATAGDDGGPIVPVTEREPNDDPSRAHVLRFGEAQSGVLPRGDRDAYRFYLAGASYIRLTVIPAPDSSVDVDLDGVFFNANRGISQTFTADLWLLPGDYSVGLDTNEPNDAAAYTILLEALNPLALPVDLEPQNNEQAGAQPLPATLVVQGRNYGRGDDSYDWYRLPVLAQATPVTVTVTGSVSNIALYDAAGVGVSALNFDRDANAYVGTLPADTPLDLRLYGQGEYTLRFAFDGGPEPLPASGALPITMTLTAEADAIAGFWHEAQQVAVSLTLTNEGDTAQTLTLDATVNNATWTLALAETAVTLAAGEQVTVPLTLRALADARTDLPTQLTVRVRGADGGQQTATFDVAAVCGIPPVNPDPAWTTAGPLVGGLNVAWVGLGAQPLGDDIPQLTTVFDDIVSPATGWRGAPDTALVVDLAGDAPLTLAGVLINPQGRTDAREYLRDFAVQASLDGISYTTVLTATAQRLPVEQAFAFAAPVEARFVQLQLLSNYGDVYNTNIGVGEFKVIAAPGRSPTATVGFDIAAPAVGGHIVYSHPLLNSPERVLTPDMDTVTLFPQVGDVPEWVMGFHHNRAAQITELQWQDRPDGRPDERFASVEVSVSTESPIGPWQPLGTWTLVTDTAEVQTFTLAEPVWARYVRFVAPPVTARRNYDYPTRLGVIERATDEEYRSILAEWGFYSQRAYYELQQAPPATSARAEADNNDGRDAAQPLAPGEVVQGNVQVNVDEDWYQVTVAEGDNTLEVVIEGEPAVNVAYALQDAAGSPVAYEVNAAANRVVLTALAEPGTYYLQLSEPKRSVVFSWDTSGSVGAYLDITYQSLAQFVRDVNPATEVVNLLPFAEPTPSFLLDEWSSDPLALMSGLTNYGRADSSSNAEAALLTAANALGVREGTRAVILFTDAESNGYPFTADLWRSLATARPRVFSFEISTGGSAHTQDLMQDWASVHGGYYDHMSSIGAFEVGFARASCILRRPAAYRLQASSTFREPPGPGTLNVVSTAGPGEGGEGTGEPTTAPTLGRGVAVELILDASGSMLQRLEGERRIDIAKAMLTELTSNVLPPGTPLALRVFGHIEPDSCRTDLEIPLQPLDAAAIAQRIAAIEARNLARTPIADSLRLVAEDLAGAAGQKVVVLVTDGEETCEGDPGAAIQYLRELNIDVRINIVGFALDDPALKAQFQAWAEAGGGFYFDANNAVELNQSVRQALRAPFRVLNAAGEEVASGVVDGGPVTVPAGVYRVEVLTEPVQVFENVIVGGEQNITLTLP